MGNGIWSNSKVIPMQEKVGLLVFSVVQPLGSCDVQQELWVIDGAFMEILSGQ